MEALLVSTGVVALAEIGDKTQLLAFILAARFKKPVPIILGILVATVLNHGLAGALGAWITSAISPEVLRWVLGLSFIGMAIWTMIPDKIEEEETQVARRFGVFGATFITFFLAEMGDKTQLMTITIAAESAQPFFILMGTTTGMLIADGIGILGGAWMAKHIPDIYIKWVAGMVFMFFGALTLYNTLPAAFITPVYVIPFFLILGALIYLFGVKLAYHEKINKPGPDNQVKKEDEVI